MIKTLPINSSPPNIIDICAILPCTYKILIFGQTFTMIYTECL